MAKPYFSSLILFIMKKNYCFVLTLVMFVVINNTLYSQDLSINLSIRWSEKPYLFNTDSIVQYPELVVSYTNNSNKKLYIKKTSNKPNGYVGFMHEIQSPYHRNENYSYINDLNNDVINKPYKNNKYIVLLSIEDTYRYARWYLKDENYTDELENLETNQLNYYIDVVNQCIYREIMGYNDTEWGNLVFTQSDISKDSIWENRHNMFMFLNPHETKDDVYNLTCLYILKGTYTFIIDSEEFKKDVVADFVPWKRIGVPLPKKVKKYKLYSGKFTSNSVTVSFE